MAFHILIFIIMFSISSITYSQKTWIVGVVPQHSAKKLTKVWKPFLRYLSQKTGEKFAFQTAPNNTVFEQRTQSARYDFVYFSPSHYVRFHKTANYNAIAKAKNKHIRGIIVVRKDCVMKNLTEIDQHHIGFPSATAFAASIIPRRVLKSKKIPFKAIYSKTHDNVYYGVANGFYHAGGGVVRTFNATDPKIKDRLKILWTSKSYPPHAIAAHQRVPTAVIKKFRNALVSMANNAKTQQLYINMKIKYGFEPATNKDWDDVRRLGIDTKN
ncbi:Phosphonate ABC transporter phosphate-binding periplasmic component (TC 3.A.1.9.1) [hydrothermal vent metagenome]|uniref:Phosphonate ABC transporter phosphate-binding periplasmic component (TC 3.A.1.9.1) n=1 Tax=hydrothermal vent metagenome TaxID=652676 RepID=A0A3B0YA07_9ZZZZ